jgi:3-phosphoglycerate kinase
VNYNKKTVREIDVREKKVLLRCDFNVPHNKETGVIQDVRRIAAAMPTIHYLLEQNAAVILCSHLGRPHGKWNPALSLASAGGCVQSMLNLPVPLTRDVVGWDTKALAANLQPGEVMLIENIRFRLEDEGNDPLFAKQLASLADVFVFDAFGASHRAHASTEGVSRYLPSVAGFLISKEIKVMGDALTHPKRPLVAILGGSKVSDKIGVIRNLLDLADTILIGGGMSYTFQAAKGGKVGKSLLQPEFLDFAQEVMQLAKDKGVQFLLPVDELAAKDFSEDAEPVWVPSDDIPDDLMGLDIGPKTIALFTKALEDAGTVIWNGPMGVFEFPAYSMGTRRIAQALAELPDAITIIGGGDSASAVEQTGFSDKITHISTGGGAALEFLEGLELPGIACLQDADGSDECKEGSNI